MKRKLLHFLKTGTARLASIAVFLLLTLALVLYQRGVYDFTFIERHVSAVPEASAGQPSDSAETEPVREPVVTEENLPPLSAETEDEYIEQTVDDQSSAQGGTQTPKKLSAKQFSESLPDAKKDSAVKGLSRMTAGEYDPDKCILARLRVSGTKKDFSVSTYQARAVQATEYERGCIVSEAVTEEQPRPGLLLRNGYIIRDDGNGKLSLLDSNGVSVLTEYDESVFRLTELRTTDGRPVFTSSAWEKQEVKVPIYEKDEYSGRPIPTGEYEPEPVEEDVEILTYYVLDEDEKGNRKWLKVFEDSELLTKVNRGLTFDSPLDYGESDCDLEAYSYGSRWGYRVKSTQVPVIYPYYKKAFNPRNGYAVAYDEFAFYIIDTKGNVVKTINFDLPDVFVTFNEITIPDTDGIESLGCYYFSHGLTRVRIRENLRTYKAYNYIKTGDYAALIDVNGEKFPIPTGYSLISYSDGVLLLKRDGEELYGYMNYKGEWIAQPTYTYARPFISGLAAVGYSAGKSGMIDTEGNFVIPMSYQYVSDVSQGNIAVYDGTTGWEVFQIFTK